MHRRARYNFLRGAAGYHGPDYQIKIITLCLLKGLQSQTNFELSSENKDAGKFDDIVYETENDSILIQVKHKENGNEEIRINQLFDSSNSVFQLHQYLSSFSEIREKFSIKYVRLLSNIGVSPGGETDLLFTPVDIDDNDIIYCTQMKCYCLREYSRDRLESNNPNIPDEVISEFIKKFQLVHIIDIVVDQQIERLILDLELFDSSLHNIPMTVEYIKKKIKLWYMAGSGYYLNNFSVSTYLCMWRSINYAQTLRVYDISFRRRYITPGNRLVYLVDRNYYQLNVIKIYQYFFEEFGEDAIMIINPEDSLSVQIKMVRAFAIPETRVLIVPLFCEDSYNNLQITDLLEQIFERDYKKIVFFTNVDNFSERVPCAQVMMSRISFDDLEECCKNKFLGTIIHFQGKEITLSDALAPNGDANNIIDEELLMILSRRGEIKIEKILDEQFIESIYIDRVFMREEEDYSENDMCHLVKTGNEKFILISDGAGMGKTMVLTRIIQLISEDPCSHFLILRLDLNRYSNVFQRFKQNGVESIEVEDILNSRATQFLHSNFNKNLFNIENKVILVTDAVDEVNSVHVPMILKFLENCFMRKNIAKIIVTTRPHLESSLEAKLNVDSFKLKVFSKENQIDFLTEYWVTNLNLEKNYSSRCKWYAEHLMDKLNNSIGHDSWSFIGIPLQTKMIADIFQKGSKLHDYKWQGCKEFLDSDNTEVEITTNINITKLYQMFVTKKGEIYAEKKCDTRGIHDILLNHFQESIKVHKKIAVESLIEIEKCKLFSIYEDSKIVAGESLADMGIVQKVEGTWVFVHQTFGEYFMATCLWDELISERENWRFLQFCLGNMLISSEFIVIRSFFENILMNEVISEKIFEACGSVLILKESTNHRYLLHIENIFGAIALHRATKHLSVIKYLVEKGADVNKKDSYGQSVLHKAAANNCVDATIFLIANRIEIDPKLRDGRTPLHLAAENNSFHVANLLIRSGAKLNEKEQSFKTPLHLAVENDSLDIVELLIREGADTTQTTGNGWTAMNIACARRNMKSADLREWLDLKPDWFVKGSGPTI
ncbi:hypothetical protein JTB14_028006 [Gonioctena quinquepunctata]|nr:hypothetical protein JTB14_028006 [Gonioctena quinquepunctata]